MTRRLLHLRRIARPAVLLLLASLARGGEAAAESVVIPAGVYRPVTRAAEEPAAIEVTPFRMDVLPVSNAEYLAFVTAHPRWRRSDVSPLFADQHYLSHWQGDLEPGPAAPPGAPVVNVSWFAARAYARHHGARLPNVAEWEVAAAAGYRSAAGRNEPEFNQELYAWLAKPTPEVLPSLSTAKANVFGVRGLHGFVWEWVEDFDTAMVTGESRADTDRDQNLFCGGAGATATDPADYAAFMRQALRSSLKARQGTSSLGFRCVRPLTSQPSPSPTK
jgi:formylglycine-generating enzyme required for sulfatase activity